MIMERTLNVSNETKVLVIREVITINVMLTYRYEDSIPLISLTDFTNILPGS